MKHTKYILACLNISLGAVYAENRPDPSKVLSDALAKRLHTIFEGEGKRAIHSRVAFLTNSATKSIFHDITPEKFGRAASSSASIEQDESESLNRSVIHHPHSQRHDVQKQQSSEKEKSKESAKPSEIKPLVPHPNILDLNEDPPQKTSDVSDNVLSEEPMKEMSSFYLSGPVATSEFDSKVRLRLPEEHAKLSPEEYKKLLNDNKYNAFSASPTTSLPRDHVWVAPELWGI